METSRAKCFVRWAIIAVGILAITDSVFIPLVVYRICYQSTSQFVPSQCVNCPFLALQGYSFSCFGNTAFPRNMTPAQAQCMIQRCQDGVKQTSVYLGRKKRDDSSKSTGEFVISQFPKSDTGESPQEKNMQVVGEIDVYVDADYDDEEMF
ncbi:uncharacterized protein LOC129964180 isoform X2 [Argiope bruennichi]|uniref:Uncharacterized protein n=2 Tax=Argiope bruennichi TaxID=94029 RepID=A0A8T0EVK0_ARGBR|nr:uncharacterized protein LOC129964180 isoform X2 [Argiope bruennichi]XP_055934874.1 uncharacterized protein LOC129964180 isoform X2 [Argiope bruennichi]KAF8782343.1 hypothetical protein HNY73_012640 [Argiope bruennichi]